MQKIMKISIFMIILMFSASVYATNMDMTSDDNEESLDIVSSTNNIYTYYNETYDDNISNNNTTSTTADYTENTNRVSSSILDSLPEVRDLGLANVLNILLIVVGIIIILLALAILTRLKK